MTIDSRDSRGTTFADRLAWARLVRHWRTGKSPDNAEIGRAVGRTGQWMTKWATSATPPPDYLDGKPLHAPLAAFLEAEQGWLIRGEGEPPLPDQWASWIAQRQSQRTAKPRESIPATSAATSSTSGRRRGKG